MTENEYLENLAEAVTHEELAAERRIGRVGPWCFACGRESSNLAPCACDFPREFHCVKLRSLCSDCREGHRKISTHLKTMFAAKRLAVYRADSRRSRLFRWLRDALETLADKGVMQAKTLRSLLGGRCDPRADEEAEFIKSVLECFARSNFYEFRGLADAIAEEERLFYVTKIAQLPNEFWKSIGL